ncbi:Ig-like domain-containing protein [Chitinophaga sedimenti]|uniref:Ig-like domain-containing protein n=1 Tax=Chitinophaga sedimenti TaxID=2033606 RepID=UPI002005ECA7|nr:Ig-like domain-containing protein [Chitinophaga sedimenti]MCK7555552.1 Ig-like domain-containing protein [Chitinophaga sedimenti]
MNEAPVGQGDMRVTKENEPVSGFVTGADADGDTLTFTKNSEPAHGSVIVKTDGTYTYTPEKIIPVKIDLPLCLTMAMVAARWLP